MMYKEGSGRLYLSASPFCIFLQDSQQSPEGTVRGDSRKLQIQEKNVQKIIHIYKGKAIPLQA
jgi:hypothetical protein